MYFGKKAETFELKSVDGSTVNLVHQRREWYSDNVYKQSLSLR